MPATLGTTEDNEEAIAYAKINPDDSIEKTVDMVWNVLSKAYEKHPEQDTHLIVETNGHRNEEGGYVEQFHLFHMNICVRFLSAFVDTLTIADLIEHDCKSITIADFLEQDEQTIAENKGEKLLGKTDSIEDATPEEIINNTTLTAQYDDENGDLYWGLSPDN